MEYFEKVENKPSGDLEWNIPEQKFGTVNIIGGNSQNFRTPVKISEFLIGKYPVETLRTVLPDALKDKLPEMPNFVFLKSTNSGSFLDAEELESCFGSADFNILIGDLSKNTETMKAVRSASEIAASPLLITRDAVDLIAENGPEKLLMNEKIIFFASMPQLIKLLRAVYYPKMLLLSQSLVQVVEVLHKFTLSYPVSIITLHSDQILVAKNGIVKSVPLEKTGYSAFMVWGGELAAKITAMNLYNPENFLDATIFSLFA